MDKKAEENNTTHTRTDESKRSDKSSHELAF